MELSVLNIAGQETGRKVELNDAIFGIEPNEHAIYLDVKQFLANNRQGTHKSKQRNEISGSTLQAEKSKKVPVAPVQVVSRTLCLEEGVECLDPYQEIIASN